MPANLPQHIVAAFGGALGGFETAAEFTEGAQSDRRAQRDKLAAEAEQAQAQARQQNAKADEAETYRDILTDLVSQSQTQGQELRELQRSGASREAATALVRASDEGDPDALNKAADNNPLLRRYRAEMGVVSDRPLNFESASDKRLLASQGITEDMYDTDAKRQALRQVMWVDEMKDGKSKLFHIGDALALSDSVDHMPEQDRLRLEGRMRDAALIVYGDESDDEEPETVEDLGVTPEQRQEAEAQLREMSKTGKYDLDLLFKNLGLFEAAKRGVTPEETEAKVRSTNAQSTAQEFKNAINEATKPEQIEAIKVNLQTKKEELEAKKYQNTPEYRELVANLTRADTRLKELEGKLKQKKLEGKGREIDIFRGQPEEFYQVVSQVPQVVAFTEALEENTGETVKRKEQLDSAAAVSAESALIQKMLDPKTTEAEYEHYKNAYLGAHNFVRGAQFKMTDGQQKALQRAVNAGFLVSSSINLSDTETLFGNLNEVVGPVKQSVHRYGKALLDLGVPEAEAQATVLAAMQIMAVERHGLFGSAFTGTEKGLSAEFIAGTWEGNVETFYAKTYQALGQQLQWTDAIIRNKPHDEDVLFAIQARRKLMKAMDILTRSQWSAGSEHAKRADALRNKYGLPSIAEESRKAAEQARKVRELQRNRGLGKDQ